MEVAERFGRTGTSEAGLLDQAGRLGRRPLLRDFQTWDATPDLTQAIREWPERWVAEPSTVDPADLAVAHWVNAR
jgi:hypothetical protein